MGAVKWTPQARNELEQIYALIHRDSPRAADAFRDRLLRATDRLAVFPEIGRRVTEYPRREYREGIVASYRVIYRCENDFVVIAAVLHGRRRLNGEAGQLVD